MSNLESQENELLSMQSIYKEQEFVVEGIDPPCGRIVAEVRLCEEFYVRVAVGQKLSSSDPIDSEEVFQVAHLPPINVSFRFPKTYPLQTCPAFSLSCDWLSLKQLSVLCKELEALWEKNKDAILYTWMQFLQDKALDFLNIGHCLDIADLLNLETSFQDLSINDLKDHSVEGNEKIMEYYSYYYSGRKVVPSISGGRGEIDSRAINDLALGSMLIQVLKDYNISKIEDVFNSSYQECKVCLLTKPGTEFVIFKECKHLFCRNCVKDYYESQISDGNVNSLKCLEGQCETKAEDTTVKELLEADIYEKYDRLLLSSTLDSMSDISYCPRKECQCACIVDIRERMAVCSACRFIFCPFCKMTYHGVAPCNFKSERQKCIFNEYMNGDAAAKKELEKRNGKRFIKSLVEDTLSEKWKNSNSKNCPRCRTSIEKTDGCNKMTCYRCGSFFCWLCMKLLKSSNPYSHYSDTTSECYNLLFPAELMLNENFDIQPEENLNQEFDVQPGEYLNLDIGFQPRELFNRAFGVQPEEFLNNE